MRTLAISNAPASDKIAEPVCQGSLQIRMKIDTSDPDIPEFSEFTKVMRACAEGLFDDTKSFTRQDPLKVRKYVSKALKEMPFLSRYERAWPALHYLKRNFLPLRKRLLKRQALSSNPIGHSVSGHEQTAPHAVSSTVLSHSNRPEAEHGQTHALNGDSVSRTADRRAQVGSRKAEVPRIHQYPCAVTVERQTPPLSLMPRNMPTPASTSLSSTAESAECFADGFKLFLRTLSPELTDLHEVFVEHGVASEKCFADLLRLPVGEREMLLKHDMRLRSLQFRNVRAALESWGNTRFTPAA
ncbi:hypothetical protein OBBRIDRAFT_883467 [Obba rivulosa]|uniref:Uncharacterized protein n=1 Tax=Obba rivulosa TaxID=1052685 RepID=A0A8E2J6R0_9APHY|nr:hypothetical protein OBBRIDRAFT_883467 [Obba rivulosa]